jgi:hypothetical protein
MAESQSGSREAKPDKIHPVDVYEGDRVLLAISPHGEIPAADYHSGLFKTVVEGEVIDAPGRDSHARDSVDKGNRPMVDYAVETDDGDVFRWNVDNGYVIGYHEELGRRTDLGHFSGFYVSD